MSWTFDPNGIERDPPGIDQDELDADTLSLVSR